MEQTPRDLWRTIWRVATSDYLLAALCLAIAAGLALTAWLPQQPLADQVAYSRWFSEVQARFGNATSRMQALGLFSVARSLGFRASLALLAACLLLRLVESAHLLQQHHEIAQPTGEWRSLSGTCLSDVVDHLRRQRYRLLGEPPLFQADRWPWADLFPLAAQAGALILLGGLLIAYLWGWRFEGLVVQGGERLALPGSGRWIAVDDTTCRAAHSRGLVVFIEACGPGVRAGASNGAGQNLLLQQTADSDPVTQLTLPLTEDRYLAIPAAQWIVRLAPQPGQAIEAHSPVLVQVYRSPPGRLVTETIVEKEAELAVGDTTLRLVSVPYARLTVTFNPGLWPTGAGLVLLGAGVLASIWWPAHRLWLREENGQVACTDAASPAVVPGREA